MRKISENITHYLRAAGNTGLRTGEETRPSFLSGERGRYLTLSSPPKQSLSSHYPNSSFPPDQKKKNQKNSKTRKRKINSSPSSQASSPIVRSNSMDLTRFSSSLVLLLFSLSIVSATGVFKVKHKFVGRGRSLSDFRAHDMRRHGRILGAADLPLGGSSLPTEAGWENFCYSNYVHSLF